jgi:hypothetical protein
MFWMALAVSLLTFAKGWLFLEVLQERGVLNVTLSNGMYGQRSVGL